MPRSGLPEAAERPARGRSHRPTRLEPWLDTSTPDPDTIVNPDTILTLSRHYPDTIPTHPETPTPVSIDTRSDTPTPVSDQCQAILTLDLIGQRQAASMVSKQNRHSDTRHP